MLINAIGVAVGKDAHPTAEYDFDFMQTLRFAGGQGCPPYNGAKTNRRAVKRANQTNLPCAYQRFIGVAVCILTHHNDKIQYVGWASLPTITAEYVFRLPEYDFDFMQTLRFAGGQGCPPYNDTRFFWWARMPTLQLQ